MSAITFDTLKFVERLEKAGMTREQSAAIVEAQKEAFAEVLDSSLVTRADLATTKSDLKADIAALRSDMQAMELRLVIKLGAFIAVAVGILIAVMRLP